MDLKKLQEENKILKQKLSIAEFWMQREVKKYIKNISKDRFSYYSKEQKDSFFSQNIEDIIEESIYNYFWDYIITFMPKQIVENIISAEIIFFNMSKTPQADWLWVISSYHKSIDILIEDQITKPFRKYFNSNNSNKFSIQNDPLEKSLNLVIKKWYILWLGRLFQLIKNIKNNKSNWFLSDEFKNFLKNNQYISDVLLDDDFYTLFEKLIDLEVLWEKRHSWKIDFSDVKISRELIVWNFRDKNSLLYKLSWIWVVDF